MIGVTLRMLVANAYEVPEMRINGGPGWRNADRFNIEASAGHPLPPWPDSNKQLSLMLQTLLQDRFKLAVHWETIDEPVYELLVSRNGGRLAASMPGENAMFDIVPGRISNRAVPLKYLSTNLSSVLGRPVIDKTGLDGKYDYVVTYAPDDRPASDATEPSLFTALQEQLGLRLQSGRSPVKVLVIDHAEKPDAN
jgi:uncharacterized protein (TIGR03435 family)